ncbi:MAG: hypothetical protein ACRDIL_11080, partial [Candidatus Limnocylindrales bacterium]
MSAYDATRVARDGVVPARVAGMGATLADVAPALRGRPVGRRRRRHVTTKAPSPVLRSPSAAPTLGSNTTLARGVAAAASMMPIIARSATQAGAARTAPMAEGAPSATARPPAMAAIPAAIAGA